MHPGVYATFSGQPDRLAVLWAAVLSAGSGAMLSYQTAAELARLADKPSDLIHVTIPADRRVARRPGIVVHRSDRAIEALHPVKLPPQTRVEETVLDLAGTARTLDDAAGWVLRASQRGLTARSYLASALAERPRTCWRAELTELLTLDADGLHSVLEHRYYRDVERPHALPAGTRQARARYGYAGARPCSPGCPIRQAELSERGRTTAHQSGRRPSLMTTVGSLGTIE